MDILKTLMFDNETFIKIFGILILFVIIGIIINSMVISKKLNLKNLISKNIKLNKFLPLNDINFRYDEAELEKDQYIRELSFEKDLNYIYWLSITYELTDKKTNIIGSYFIKWYDEGRIKINNHQNNPLIKKDNIIISILDGNNIDNEKEKELFLLIKKASRNNLLDKEEFSNWLFNNYKILNSWFDNLYVDVTKKLENSNKIIFEENEYVVSDELLSDVKTLNGFKNFLNNFSKVSDKSIKNIKLLEHYLIIAQLLGLNSLIKKELGKIYPEFLFDIDAFYDIEL